MLRYINQGLDGRAASTNRARSNCSRIALRGSPLRRSQIALETGRPDRSGRVPSLSPDLSQPILLPSYIRYRVWSGRPVLKSRSEQLYEKAEEEGQRCRDWLLPQLGRCGE